MMKIAIIDYNMGNLFSVQHACEHVGLDPIITQKPDEIIECSAAILPGVGAFAEAMNNINRLGLSSCIKDFIATQKPFMGICLGLQLLFTESEEFGNTKGLGIIDGQVLRFPNESKVNSIIRVPQIGWNKIYRKDRIDGLKKWNNSPLLGIENNQFMYFVHSFYVKPQDKNNELTLTNYEGIEYCSSILFKNIFACQFHPEKSAIKGIEIYKNWAKKINKTGEVND